MNRKNVPVECWDFVSRSENPGDLTTRPKTLLANLCDEKRFHGSSFWQLPESGWPNLDKTVQSSKDILYSEKRNDISILLNSVLLEEGIGNVMTIEKLRYLRLHRNY